MSDKVVKDTHKSTSYSGKKPYLTHNYRTMMKKKTSEEYYFHELHEDAMSELLRPYLHDPELPGFTGYEYMAPSWDWPWPPWGYPGAGPGGGGVGPYDDDDGIPTEHCTECKIVGSGTAECDDAWFGQIIPSQCAGFITFAMGIEAGESFPTVATAAGAVVVTLPAEVASSTMLVCSSGGLHGVTCCLEVKIECEDECCEAITLVGADTVTSGDSWVGTISPACSALECSVVSNSGCSIGCTINPAGSQVIVATDGADCGSFTVTVTQAAEGDCPGTSATKVVRLSEGNWNICNSLTFGGTHICYGDTWIEGMYKATVDCGTGGWGFINARDCVGNIIHRFDYIPDCSGGSGSCTSQSHTRGYTSVIWSCTC